MLIILLQPSRDGQKGIDLKFVMQLVESSRVEAGAQSQRTGLHPKRLLINLGGNIRQSSPYGLIQGFLETLPRALHRILEELLDIRVNGDGRSHNDAIVAAVNCAVKMSLSIAAGGMSRGTCRHVAPYSARSEARRRRNGVT